MGISCMLGFHKWDGRKCKECGKTKEVRPQAAAAKTNSVSNDFVAIAFGSKHNFLLSSLRNQIRRSGTLFLGAENGVKLNTLLNDCNRFKIGVLLAEIRPPSHMAYSPNQVQSWVNDVLCSVPNTDVENIDVNMDKQTGSFFITFTWNSVTGLAIRTLANGIERAVSSAGGIM